MYQSYAICFPTLAEAAEHTLVQRVAGPYVLRSIDDYPTASSATYQTDAGYLTLEFSECSEPTVLTVGDAWPYALGMSSILIFAFFARSIREALQ